MSLLTIFPKLITLIDKKKIIEEEPSAFVYNNYHRLQKDFSREQIKKFFDNNNDKIIVIRKNCRIVGVGFYYKLSNRSFEEVKKRILSIENPVNSHLLLKENGRNIHLVFAVAKGMEIIRMGIKQIIIKIKPKTISWFSKDMEKFVCFKIKEDLCHQLPQQLL